ncbi:NAD(P)-dependent alcohol dehydrogenase [Sphingomonas canadensis]|uniref:NAD(P)-dependent alcohol dehydrogenase n=1 Tax=Sphingomonas canadensis TaxID=1219257 RepID=A0ABW3H8C1_9SPHN|nr:NAD(P)-dependent alcohol dehydrogenase [Sphingomonas canadensis]MCW3835652.1 NAD(P)-dependent alcohol dehydrogenase [Sphingomonas canadensis]
MKAWQLGKGAKSLDDLHLVELPTPIPGAGEVLIRVRACSLNYRDQAVVTGNYFGGVIQQDLIPLSDGAGEVVSTGPGVTRFKAGDRVAGLFFQNWLEGPPNPAAGPALGAPPAHGMLAEYVLLPERGVTHIAASLSFDQAATLPCAGVTAWHALMEGPKHVGPGRSVLVLGTGGVSMLALQIAKAAGAFVIATSGSDAKLERARAMGADATINYKAIPEWGAEAARIAGGGIDHVVEVGGTGTINQSIAAVGFGGEVALIGVMTRGDTQPHGLMMKGASIRGIFVGSGAMAAALNRAIDVNGIKPVIGATFAFDAAKEAYRHAISPDLFGKTVITV